MDFYDNQFVKIEKLQSNFLDLYKTLQANCHNGIYAQTVTPQEIVELERMTEEGLKPEELKKLRNLQGNIANPRHPFLRFVPVHVGSPFIISDHDDESWQSLFSLTPKNKETGIYVSEMEFIKQHYHFVDWRDEIKYHDNTIYTQETSLSFLEQALPHFEKFYVIESGWPLLDKTPQKAQQTERQSRREEISKKEMEEIIARLG